MFLRYNWKQLHYQNEEWNNGKINIKGSTYRRYNSLRVSVSKENVLAIGHDMIGCVGSNYNFERHVNHKYFDLSVGNFSEDYLIVEYY
ncbi:hypothetical protein [Clostridium lundense]|uniref:hypothetical protein n=1 Tax=Clostridium lundense TaxID=319475 RepID=UPI0004895282|nr:hypothetical protein [Clostridium lundense]